MYQLQKLPYDYKALEPVISGKIMQLHHDKHHATYINNVNEALKGTEFAQMSIEEVLKNIQKIPESIRTKVQNNGGGHADHTLFWKIMKPPVENNKPSTSLDKIFSNNFVSFENFKEEMMTLGKNRFGSGWVWLVKNPQQELKIYSTANQDSPYMTGDTPILGIDVWERAYYLDYLNDRAAYLSKWWQVVNWEEVEKRLV